MGYLIKICCLVQGIKIINDNSIEYEHSILLSKNGNSIYDFLGEEHKEEFESFMGRYFASNLHKHYHLLLNLDIDYNNGDDKSLFMEKVCKDTLEDLQNISNFLWLVKDNSVNTSMLLAGSKELGRVHSATLISFFYNCSGENKDTEFSLYEFKKALYYRKRLFKLLNEREIIYNKIYQEGIQVQPNSLNNIDFTKEHRIDVAFRLLVIARESDFVPHKVFSYMSIFEALFTFNNKDIAKCISRRVCKYLEVAGKSKRELSSLLIKGYDIRSRFVHGNLKEYNINDILEVSSKIDDILRTIWLKIIESDSELFMKPKEEFEQWLKSLWENDYSDDPIITSPAIPAGFFC